jgi:hypothetical protein
VLCGYLTPLVVRGPWWWCFLWAAAAKFFAGERCKEFLCRLVLLGDGVAAESVLGEV